MIGGFVFKSTVSGMDEPEFRTIVVSAGDTLWDIADEHSENGDVRSLVQDICSINNIAASDLYPGQAIKIPAV
jgi:LysM repeat protein